MEFRPILSAMWRNKTGAVLVTLQVAIALAVVCNAWYITSQRLDLIARPSGYVEDDLVTVQVVGYKPDYDVKAAVTTDLLALRALPGVEAATVMPFLPLGGSGIGWGFAPLPPDQMGERRSTGATLFMTDDHGLDALGLQLVAGRWFRAEEMATVTPGTFAQTPLPSVVVSQAMADALFPEGGALGRTVYGVAGNPSTIVGILARAQGLNVNSASVERSVWAPMLLTGANSPTFYAVRTAPGQAAAMQATVQQKLLDIDPRRIVRDMQTMAAVRDAAYRNDQAMAVTLVVVIGLMVAVTALNLYGLAAFNVNRRTRQIGTRRALGARRTDIVRYFLTESWLLSSMGAALGVVLAFALSVWLFEQFNLPKLDWRYLPVGVVLLWLVGQLAAYGPARRAAAIPPATATRNV